MKYFKLKIAAIHILLVILIYHCLCVYIFPITYNSAKCKNAPMANIPKEQWDAELLKLDTSKLLAYISQPNFGGELYTVAVYPDKTLVIIYGKKNENLIDMQVTEPYSEVYYVKKQKLSISRYYYLIDLAEQVKKEQKPGVYLSDDAHIYPKDLRYKGNRYFMYHGRCIPFDKIFEDITLCNNVSFYGGK